MLMGGQPQTAGTAFEPTTWQQQLQNYKGLEGQENAWRTAEGSPWKPAEPGPVAKAIGNALTSQTGQRMMDLANFLGPGPKMPMRAMAPDGPKGIRAYHGSPHDFDKFDLSRIGTGEGAQAYGPGAYFAESEAVAKQYRKNLSTQAEESPENVAAQWLKQANGDKARALAIAKEARLARPGDDVLMFAEDAIATGAPLPAPTHPAGRMYEVNIKADPDQFLDWDVPLQAQSERVKQAVEPALRQIAAEMGQGASAEKLAQLEAMGLGNIAARLQPKTIDPWSVDTGTVAREYSHRLREAGIPGIRYKDQGSRGAEGGTSNYVVFDDKLIDIVKKYGLAALLMGGATGGGSNSGNAAP
jgi:hypothetical protein